MNTTVTIKNNGPDFIEVDVINMLATRSWKDCVVSTKTLLVGQEHVFTIQYAQQLAIRDLDLQKNLDDHK